MSIRNRERWDTFTATLLRTAFKAAGETFPEAEPPIGVVFAVLGDDGVLHVRGAARADMRPVSGQELANVVRDAIAAYIDGLDLPGFDHLRKIGHA